MNVMKNNFLSDVGNFIKRNILFMFLICFCKYSSAFGAGEKNYLPEGKSLYETMAEIRIKERDGYWGQSGYVVKNNIPKQFMDPYDFDLLVQNYSTRREIAVPDGHRRGSIYINVKAHHLFLFIATNRAIMYDVGVGREGFEWHGVAVIGRKAAWPNWTPPKEMLRRDPSIPIYMRGGLDNPLGARSLYLFQNGIDTLYRIHGTNDPSSIGIDVSSGCIRLLNSDIIDLFNRVKIGTTVTVE